MRSRYAASLFLYIHIIYSRARSPRSSKILRFVNAFYEAFRGGRAMRHNTKTGAALNNSLELGNLCISALVFFCTRECVKCSDNVALYLFHEVIVAFSLFPLFTTQLPERLSKRKINIDPKAYNSRNET